MTAVQKTVAEITVGWKPTSVQNVWELPDGKFSWTDETGVCGDNIAYAFIEDAVSALTVYVWFGLEGLGQRLKTEDMVITFKKADGTLRTMNCTARPDAFSLLEGAEHSGRSDPDVQVVFDLDKQAIRSFRKDSVISIAAR